VWPSHDSGLPGRSSAYGKEETPLLIAGAWGHVLLAVVVVVVVVVYSYFLYRNKQTSAKTHVLLALLT